MYDSYSLLSHCHFTAVALEYFWPRCELPRLHLRPPDLGPLWLHSLSASALSHLRVPSPILTPS